MMNHFCCIFEAIFPVIKLPNTTGIECTANSKKKFENPSILDDDLHMFESGFIDVSIHYFSKIIYFDQCYNK